MFILLQIGKHDILERRLTAIRGQRGKPQEADMLYEDPFIQTIIQHEQLMHDLRRVRSLHLPQSYIGAGYIRNY